MRHARLTKVAWMLLQRLSQESAELAFCADRRCSRYHVALRGKMMDVVRQSTMDALAKGALLRRLPGDGVRYGLNDHGRRMLMERIAEAEFKAEVEQDYPRIATVLIKEAVTR